MAILRSSEGGDDPVTISALQGVEGDTTVFDLQERVCFSTYNVVSFRSARGNALECSTAAFQLCSV